MDRKLTRAEAGSLGGRATGPQKSWILKLSPEERSAHMQNLIKKRWAKKKGEEGEL